MSVCVAIATGLQRQQQQVTEEDSDDQLPHILFWEGICGLGFSLFVRA
jgi:hypothetical protein